MEENPGAFAIWENAEKFDPRSEQLFTYVQVFTACLNSFAHGANDVANAIAPLSAILAIYQRGELSAETPVQKWILVYGGVAIVIGLLCFGYRVIKSIGFKLSALSPSRGATAGLASSLFVVTASFLGIPVSSTQAIVGAVTGVGLVGGVKNLQWWFLLRVCIGWVVIFLFAIILNAGLFAMFAFSPSLTE
jgi:solute carrier family 20 (sodium-dependent phosphate transporter)